MPPVRSEEDPPDLVSSQQLVNVRFGSIADTQRPENFRMAEFRAENTSASVRLRPIADTDSKPHHDRRGLFGALRRVVRLPSTLKL